MRATCPAHTMLFIQVSGFNITIIITIIIIIIIAADTLYFMLTHNRGQINLSNKFSSYYRTSSMQTVRHK